MPILGIDPGQSGGMVLLLTDGSIVDRLAFANKTEHDIRETFMEYIELADLRAYIETVHSMPGQGVASTFKFGRNFGFLIGMLTAMAIPYELVTPQKWQKAMGIPPRSKNASKGDHKRNLKSAAQRLWPRAKWTLAICDAALIAEYGRTLGR